MIGFVIMSIIFLCMLAFIFINIKATYEMCKTNNTILQEIDEKLNQIDNKAGIGLSNMVKINDNLFSKADLILNAVNKPVTIKESKDDLPDQKAAKPKKQFKKKLNNVAE